MEHTTITGAGGSDTIVAGSGNVTFTMNGGTAVFVGGTGRNIINNDPGTLTVVVGGSSSPEYNYYDLNGPVLNFWDTGGSESSAASDTINGAATINLESVSSGTASFSVENYNSADSLTLNSNGNTGATVSVTDGGALDLNGSSIGDNGGTITLQSSFSGVTLKGNATGSHLTVTNSEDYGTVDLDATTGSETFAVNLQSSGSYTVDVTGDGTGNTLNIVGSTAGNTVDITSSAVSIGSQTVDYHVIQTLDVATAATGETVDITGTSAATTVNTGKFADIINVGSEAILSSTNTGGNLSGITTTLTIDGSSSSADILNLDSTGNSANSVATLSYDSTTAVSTLANVSGQTDLFGSGGSVNFKGIQTVNLGLGNGNNTFTIEGSSAGTINITSGSGNDTFNIQALNGAVNATTGTGTNTVNIGSLEPTVGGVIEGIKGTLTVTGGGTTTMNVDDTGDTGTATGTMTASEITGFGMGVGSINYSAITTLNVSLGSGANTFTITNTNRSTTTTVNGESGNGSITLDDDAAMTTINSDSGDYTVNIEATGGTTNVNDTSGTDIINIGSEAPATGGIVNNIDDEVDVTGDGSDTVNVDDTGSSGSKTGLLTSTTLTGLGMGARGIAYSGLAALNISLGSGTDTMNVQSTVANAVTTINTGTGTNTKVNVTSNAPSASGGTLNGIAGELIVSGQGTDILNVNDEANPNPGTLTEASVGTASATATDAMLTGLDIVGEIEFNSVPTVNILLNNLGNTIYIQANPYVTTLNLTGGTDSSHPNIISFGSSAQSSIDTDYSNPADATEGEQTNVTGSIIDYIAGTINYTGSGGDTMIVDDSGDLAGTQGAMGTTATGTNYLKFLSQETDYATVKVIINFSGIANATISLSQGANNFVVEDTFTSSSSNTVITVDCNSGVTNFLIFDTHAVMTVNGGSGNDSFYVFGNSAVLNLNGDTGNDTFYVYASLVENTSNVNTGAGASKVYSYRVNATVNINGGTGDSTVYIFGTVLSDTFIIYSTTTGTSVTGAGLNVNLTSVKHLVIEGLNGNNVFYIESINIPVTIYGNGSLILPSLTTFLNALGLTLPDTTGGATPSTSFDDTFYVGAAGELAGVYFPEIDGSLAGIEASLTIYGSNGPVGPDGTTVPIPGAVNTVYVDDSGDTQSQSFTLTSSTANGGGVLAGTGFGAGGSLTFDDAVNNLNFQMGNGNNTVTVDGNDTATQTSIYGGRGYNQFIVNDFSTYAWQAPVELYGGLSVFQGNTLTVNGDASGNTFAVTGFTIVSSFANGSAAATVDYEEMQSLTIDAGGPTTFNVNGDSTPTYLNGGAGADAFDVNSNVVSLFLTSGTGSDTYVINGNAGTLTVTGYVSGDTGNNNVTVNANSGTATINGGPNGDVFVINGNSGGLTINGGSGTNSFVINALSAPAALNGGSGNNTFTVNTPLAAVLTVNGGGGAGDWLIVNGSTGNDSITITGSAVSGLGSPISYSATNLEVNGISGNDTFLVDATSSFITRVNGGLSGNDTFNVQANTGALYLNGSSEGNNVFNLGSLAPLVGGTLANLAGPIYITGGTNLMRFITRAGSGTNTVNVDDSGDTSANTGTLTSSTLTGLGMGGVTYVSINFMNITLGSGSDTFNVQSTNSTTQTTLNTGSGTDVVNVGSLEPAADGLASGVQGALIVKGGGNDTMNVDDTGDTAGQTGTLTSTTLTGLGMGDSGIVYSGLGNLNISLGQGGNTFLIISTPSATTRVNGGMGNDTFNVRATTGTLYLSGGGGSNVYNLGSLAPGTGGTVSGLSGAVFISGGTSFLRLIALADGTNTVNIDDTGDTTNVAGTLTSSTLTGLGMGVGVTFVSISAVNINLGSGTDTYNIQSTNSTTVTTLNTGTGTDTVNLASNAATTYINLGGGNDFVNIQTTNATTYVNNTAGADTIDIGSNAPGAGGNVNGILGAVVVDGDGSDTLNVDDTGSTVAKAGTLTASTLTGLGMGLGISYSGVAALNISLGSGGNSFIIGNTNAATVTTLNSGAGSDTVNLITDSGTTIINTQTGIDTVNVTNDAGTTTINTGGGNDTVNIQATGAVTTVNNTAGADTIDIGYIAPLLPLMGSIVNGIQGAVVVTGDGSDTLNVDDAGSLGNEMGTLTATTLTGLGMGVSGITYSGLTALNISLGGGGNTFVISSTFASTVTTYTDAGTNTVDVGRLTPATNGVVSPIQGALMINGSGSDILNVDNTGSAAAGSGTLTATTLTGLGMGAAGITYSGLATLNISLGSGNDSFTVTGVTNTTVTTVNGEGGTNTAILNFSGDFGGNLTLLNFVTATLNVGGNFGGQLTDAGAVTPVTIGGSLTSTGVLTVGSIATMTVGGNLAGELTVAGLLGTLTVDGAAPGQIVVGSVNVINVLAGYGNSLLNITAGGIQREILATPVAGGAMPNTVTFAFVYDSETSPTPQLAIQVTNADPVARSYNLALVVVNSATAKFDLSLIDSKSNALTGLSNISVDGDLLEGLTAPELLLFTNLNSSSRGGVVLPADSITGVEVSGILPIGYVDVAGIEGVAFAVLTTRRRLTGDDHQSTRFGEQHPGALELSRQHPDAQSGQRRLCGSV